jgi:hypothetical protein
MTDPIRAALEKAAEALWQAESLRAAGVQRRTEWHEEGEHTRQKWRFMAAHGNAAFLRALPEGYVEVPQPDGTTWQLGMNNIHAGLLAQAVLAAAKEERE